MITSIGWAAQTEPLSLKYVLTFGLGVRPPSSRGDHHVTQQFGPANFKEPYSSGRVCALGLKMRCHARKSYGKLDIRSHDASPFDSHGNLAGYCCAFFHVLSLELRQEPNLKNRCGHEQSACTRSKKIGLCIACSAFRYHMCWVSCGIKAQ